MTEEGKKTFGDLVGDACFCQLTAGHVLDHVVQLICVERSQKKVGLGKNDRRDGRRYVGDGVGSAGEGVDQLRASPHGVKINCDY